MKLRLFLAMAGMLTALHSTAAPIAFQFESQIDASPAGGSVNAPLRVTYVFDSTWVNGSGPVVTTPSIGSYGAFDSSSLYTLEIELEGQSVFATGGGIIVSNDAGLPVLDRYEVRVGFSGTYSGTLYGSAIDFFRISLVDPVFSMFSGTALPLTPGFVTAGLLQDTEIVLRTGSSLVFLQNPLPDIPYSLTMVPVPEPSTYALMAVGLGLLAWRQRRTTRLRLPQSAIQSAPASPSSSA